MLKNKMAKIKDNFISLTDIARSKNSDEPKDVFKNDCLEIKTIKIKAKEQKNTQEFDVEYERSFQHKLDRAEFKKIKAESSDSNKEIEHIGENI